MIIGIEMKGGTTMSNENTEYQLNDGRRLVQTESALFNVPSPIQMHDNELRKKRNREHDEMYLWFSEHKEGLEELLNRKG